MKTKLILGSLIALASAANAQWSGTSILTTMSDVVGIGTTAPGDKLHVVSDYNDGITITQTTYGGANLTLNNTQTSGRKWILGSHGPANSQGVGNFSIYDYTGAVDRFLIQGTTGNVGIGTMTPADKLSVAGNAAPSIDNSYTCGTSARRWSAIWATNGTIQTSDIRFKKDIKKLNYGMTDIMKLRPVSYNWKEGDTKTHLGFIAQELREVIGEVVYEGTDANKNLGVSYTELVPVLIAGIQEQQHQIDNQSKENSALKAELADLKKQVADLAAGKAGAATGISQINAGVDGFALDQNIPNPFNGETVIKYTLPAQYAAAALVVYDLSGKQISSFPIVEKGSSSLSLSSEKLAAGIYIYSVVADGKILDSKRMVVSGK